MPRVCTKDAKDHRHQRAHKHEVDDVEAKPLDVTRGFFRRE
jgi:hypothetical protein